MPVATTCSAVPGLPSGFGYEILSVASVTSHAPAALFETFATIATSSPLRCTTLMPPVRSTWAALVLHPAGLWWAAAGPAAASDARAAAPATIKRRVVCMGVTSCAVGWGVAPTMRAAATPDNQRLFAAGPEVLSPR